ncbi:hypothetical protein [Algoriphagus aquimarinus]|uniref:hypothetical protein n=1 Tax=Algoriphagus aquimarinus TaxID=237018 RepID=UPI0030D78296|tara:strand:+ start:190825 stop:191286 length:462 start_codon:yes stop_codon:yes gene_type:complete
MAVKITPVSQNLAFNTHVDHVAKEFSFLISEFEFVLSKNEFVGREFWIVYSKELIDIEILFEVGGLPFVTMRNNKLEHDEALYIDNGDSIEEFNPRAQQIKNSRYERREKQGTEVSDDYTLYGRDEHIEYLREAARTVRENIELKRGSLGIRG